MKRRKTGLDFSALLTPAQGRTRDLWEHLSGRAEHSFQLGARGCQDDNGVWLLNVDGNFWTSFAIEHAGDLYEVGTVPNANPVVTSAADSMTVFKSDAEIAKAKRKQRLATMTPLEAEVEMLNSQGVPDRARVVQQPGEGMVKAHTHTSAAPRLNPV